MTAKKTATKKPEALKDPTGAASEKKEIQATKDSIDTFLADAPADVTIYVDEDKVGTPTVEAVHVPTATTPSTFALTPHIPAVPQDTLVPSVSPTVPNPPAVPPLDLNIAADIDRAEQEAADADAGVAAKKMAKDNKPADGSVMFVSTNKELLVDINAGGTVYKPQWDSSKNYLIWTVDKENVKNFENHSFVKHGKITRAL